MDYVLIAAISLLAATLTLFSGFGLGTILLPVFALVFPVPVAVAATAVVHLANNIFKLFLIGKWADRSIVIRFGLPAIGGAFVGALALGFLAGIESLATYTLFGAERHVTVVKLTIGALVTFFALFELVPRLKKIQMPPRWIWIGGLLSGFFGGLSGHQGALRSATLVRTGLSKEGYIGAASVVSTMVDVTRLIVYLAGGAILTKEFGAVFQADLALVGVAIVCAFAGSYIGSRLVRKVTLEAVHLLIGVMLVAIGVALATGVL